MWLAQRDEHPSPGAYHLAAAGLCLIAVSYGLARFAYGLFVPAMRSEFGLDASAAGLIGAGSYVGYCGAVVASSVLTARWGARAVAVITGVLATTGTAVVAAAPNAPALAFGVLLAGTSAGVASPPLASAVTRHVRVDLRDRVQAVVNAGTGLGVLVSGPAALLADTAWRWAWASFSVLAAAVTVWIATTLPSEHARTASTAGQSRGLPVLVPPGSLRMMTAAVVMGAASSAVWTFGPDLVVRETGSGLQASVLLWIALGGAGLVGALTGDLARRIGLARAWISFCLAMAAATVGVAVAASSYPVAVVAGGLFGAVYITLTAVLLIWGTRMYPHAPAFGVGAAFLMIALGQAGGAPLIGWLIDHTGAVTAFLIVAAVAASACLPYPRLGRSSNVARRSAVGDCTWWLVVGPPRCAPGGMRSPWTASGDNGDMEVLSSRVLLRPSDPVRSQRFYRDTLGLAVYREFGSPDAPSLVFFLGNGLLEISGRAMDPPGEGIALWMQVRDVHAEHRRLLGAGVTILREPRLEPWGLVELWVTDPDGVRIVMVEIPDDHPLRRDQRGVSAQKD